MADNNIRFKLTSQFQGEGFDRANKAINENKKEIDSVKDGLRGMANSFKEISPEAEKATGTIGQFIGAFTKGGIVGGVIALAMAGLSEAVKFCGEKLKEAKEKAETFANYLAEQAVNGVGALSQSVKQLQVDLTNTISLLEKWKDTDIGSVRADYAQQVANIKLDYMKQIEAAETEASKAVIKAKMEYQLALIKDKERAESFQIQKEALDEKELQLQKAKETAESKLADIDGEITAFKEKEARTLNLRQNLQENIDAVEKEYADGVRSKVDADKLRTQLVFALTELESKNKDVIDNLTKLETDRASVVTELTSLEQKLADSNRDRIKLGDKYVVDLAESKVAQEQCKISLKERQKAEQEYAKSVNENAEQLERESIIDAILDKIDVDAQANSFGNQLENMAKGLKDIMNVTGNAANGAAKAADGAGNAANGAGNAANGAANAANGAGNAANGGAVAANGAGNAANAAANAANGAGNAANAVGNAANVAANGLQNAVVQAQTIQQMHRVTTNDVQALIRESTLGEKSRSSTYNNILSKWQMLKITDPYAAQQILLKAQDQMITSNGQAQKIQKEMNELNRRLYGNQQDQLKVINKSINGIHKAMKLK